MLGSVLPFSPDLADRVSEYCEKHSKGKQNFLLTLAQYRQPRSALS